MVRIKKEVVKRLMFEKDMNQKKLVDISGISKPTLNRLMAGLPFDSMTLGRLATALECNPVDLIDGSEYPAPHMDTQASNLQPACAS